MKRNLYARLAIALLASAALLDATPPAPVAARDFARPAPETLNAARVAAPPEPQSNNVNVNGFFSVDPAQQGSNFQAAVVMEIPGGLHVNSNRPLGKYAVATTLKVDAPKGLRVTPVTYPRATVRAFRFGGATEERLAVYEGRALFRFNVSVPANYEQGVARIRVSVRFQSCNDEVCFPPATRELQLPIAIVSRDTPINHINGQYFVGGGGRRRKG
jgi:DsbC/DsbD-like thiol-disulfide interchange protein